MRITDLFGYLRILVELRISHSENVIALLCKSHLLCLHLVQHIVRHVAERQQLIRRSLYAQQTGAAYSPEVSGSALGVAERIFL